MSGTEAMGQRVNKFGDATRWQGRVPVDRDLDKLEKME